MRLKKCLIYVLTFLLLCHAVLLGEWQDAYVAHANNDSTTNNTTIIRDGDFEASTGASATNVQPGANSGLIGSSEWGYYQSSGGTKAAMNYEVVAEAGRSGNAMKVYPVEGVTSENFGKGLVKQDNITGLEAGKTYMITLYAKAVNLNADSQIRFKLVYEANKSASDWVTANACGEWTQITKVFTAEAKQEADGLEIHMNTMTQNGYWLLDDISIVEIVPSISVNPKELNLEVGDVAEIAATLDDEYKVLGEEPVLEWSSSDTNVVSADQNGKVTAVGAGQATVTVKASDDVTAECKVVVAAKADDSTTNNTTIIRDGDFEASTGAVATNVQPGANSGLIGSSEWGYYQSSGGTKAAMNYEVVAEAGRSGNAMKVYPVEGVTSENFGKGLVKQDNITGLEAGKTYMITLYAKAVNLNADSQIRFKLVYEANKSASDWVTANACGEWTQITKVFTAEAKQEADGLEIHMNTITQNGYWLLDDISIVEIVPTINVNPTELSLEVGGIANITATLDDEYKVLGEEPVLEWSSSDANVVSVDQNGKVTAVAAGQATVTVKASEDVTAECMVTVTEKADDSTTVLIRNGDFEAPAGELATNIGVGAGGGTIGTTEWRYHHSSSGTKVPMNYEVTEGVGRTGKALKISPDTSVSADAIGKGLILQGEITGLKAGQKYVITLYAKAVDLNDDAQIKFILANGTEKVRSDAVKANTCGEWTKVTKEFTAVTPGASGDGIEIHMDSIKQNGYWLLDDISITRVPTFAIDKTELNLEVGDSAEITITLDDPHKVLGENPVFVWSNSDGDVVTMTAENEKAAITAKDIGKAVITVKSEDGSVGAECEVNVTAKKIISNGDFALGTEGWTTGTNVAAVAEGRSNNALQITADDGFAQNVDEKISANLLAAGSKYLVTVYAKPVGANSDSAVTVSWYDSETANAVTNEIKADAVGDSDGWIKIIKEFTAGDMSAAGTKLAVQVSNLTSGYWLFDDISIKRMPSVSLTPAEMNIIVGEKAEIDATMIDPDYILDKAPAFNYSSADESIAKVDLRGRVTGVSAGTTTITVTNAYYPEYSANCTVHVSAIDLTSISLPESLNLCEAEQRMLMVTFTPADATNQAITWSSSDVEVVVVDENGLVTGMKAGTATITATGANNLTATCTVTVRKSTTLLTEEAKIKSTTYQEVVNSFVEFVTNNTGAEATYSLYEAPEKGVLKVNEDGSFSYIPRNGQVGDSENFTVIVNAGTEYAFLKGSVELVEAIVDSDDDTDSDSNLDSDSDTDSDSDIDSDSDSDTGNDTDNDIDSDSSSDATGESSSDTDSNTSGDSSAGDNEPNEATGDTADSTKTADATKTGDNSNVGLWLLLLAIAVAALGGAGYVLYRKKL